MVDLPANSIDPALDALKVLKHDVKKRIGTEGGTLNELWLQRIATIESVVKQIPTLQSMLNTLNQQSQLANSMLRNMSRQLEQVKAQAALTNGTDDPSETKGE